MRDWFFTGRDNMLTLYIVRKSLASPTEALAKFSPLFLLLRYLFYQSNFSENDENSPNY